MTRRAHWALRWRTVRWILALILAFAALWLSLRQVQWQAVADAVGRANVPLLALALATVIATTLAKGARWWLLLRTSAVQASLVGTIRVLLIGQMGNSLLPARLGDAARIMLMGRHASGGMPATLGTLVAEKALDGLFGLLIILGLSAWAPLPAWLRTPGTILLLVTLSAVSLLALAAIRPRSISRIARTLLQKMSKGRQEQLRQRVDGFRLGVELLRSPGLGLVALGLTAAIWCLAVLTNFLTVAAFELHVPGWGNWLVLVTGYVATFLPAVPAQIGVFEYACVLALTASGLAPEPALVFGLTLHLLVYAPPALLGPVAAALEGVNWGTLRNAQ